MLNDEFYEFVFNYEPNTSFKMLRAYQWII